MDIVIYIFVCLLAVSVINQMLRRSRMARWSKNPGLGVEYFVPIKGFNAFVGLRKDAIISEGIWFRGYSGIIPFNRITKIEFELGKENITVPHMVVVFTSENGSTRSVRYIAMGTIIGSTVGDYRKTFIKLCETAVFYWNQSR